ncbi:MAG: ribonuclease P protein subunit [Candidatus Thermoplasmatota archaeon]|jgi:ribonuclease P protein subunit POP4|nr:ribonuclease P protein subunit [Candidatus Thermoplasmatota archaeon]MCL5930126.1 ribonuclease P protein subunit [Candidatus Thermoplasmatota archaeon]
MNPYLTDVVGTNVKVIKHSDPTIVGMEGRIVDERKNILTIETARGERIVPKTSGTLLIGDQEATLERMRLRPEDKMKKTRRKGRR